MSSLTTYTRRILFGACMCLCVVALLLPAQHISAQDSLSVSVTPPLFQLTIGPGEFWSSNLKVVNSNPYDVTYYAEAVDFEAEGELGRSKFLPLMAQEDMEERRTFSLASWISVSPEPVFIPSGMSKEIPFEVNVPADAEPGGHYAAILVGTQPGGLSNPTGPSVKISSFVSSLFFVRISGEVIESGRIREFVTTQSLYQKPTADFILRFENTGNTHLQPQGDITIYSMWGKERGKLFINQKTNFGHVLPDSTRKFSFTWTGEHDALDFGRYSAVVTLGFGEESKRNVTATTYFWVIPLVPVLVGLTLFATFAISILLLMRTYIRRALTLERSRLGINDAPVPAQAKTPVSTFGALVEPIKEGVIDLSNVALRSKKPPMPAPLVLTQQGIATRSDTVVPDSPNTPLTLAQFAHKYRLFFMFVCLVVLGVLIGTWYFNRVLVSEKQFEISGVSLQEEEGIVEETAVDAAE